MIGAPFWLTLAEITSAFGPMIGLMEVAAQRARPFLTFLGKEVVNVGQVSVVDSSYQTCNIPEDVSAIRKSQELQR
jgi:hypothetical protein